MKVALICGLVRRKGRAGLWVEGSVTARLQLLSLGWRSSIEVAQIPSIHGDRTMRCPWPLAVHRVYESQHTDDAGKTTIRDIVSQVGLHATENSYWIRTFKCAMCRPSGYQAGEDACYYIFWRRLIAHSAIAYLKHQIESSMLLFNLADSTLNLGIWSRKHLAHAIFVKSLSCLRRKETKGA